MSDPSSLVLAARRARGFRVLDRRAPSGIALVPEHEGTIPLDTKCAGLLGLSDNLAGRGSGAWSASLELLADQPP